MTADRMRCSIRLSLEDEQNAQIRIELRRPFANCFFRDHFFCLNSCHRCRVTGPTNLELVPIELVHSVTPEPISAGVSDLQVDLPRALRRVDIESPRLSLTPQHRCDLAVDKRERIPLQFGDRPGTGLGRRDHPSTSE